MAAPRPPSANPLPETIDDSLTDETAPPMRSPLSGVLPFGPKRPLPPGVPPPAPSGHGAPGFGPRAAAAPFGEETAPAERSPLAAALPFRHARPMASTVGIPMPTAEDLRRMAQGGANAAALATPVESAEAAARAKLAMAKTVGFEMPPVPADKGPVAATSTGHFGLSLEQYAALCAEVAVFPQTAEAIFAKYGLGASRDRLTADLAWQERLRADNALMQRWQSLYLHYHEYHHSHSSKR